MRITSRTIVITTIGAASTIAATEKMIVVIANHDIANRRWKALPVRTAMSGAAWVCPACRACPELGLRPLGRHEHTFNTKLPELGLGNFGFLTRPERPDLNASFQRRGDTAQGQLGMQFLGTLGAGKNTGLHQKAGKKTLGRRHGQGLGWFCLENAS